MRPGWIVALICLGLCSCTNCYKQHLVITGQSVYDVAARYGLTERELRDMNHISQSAKPRPGDVLFVPCDREEGDYSAEREPKNLKPLKPRPSSSGPKTVAPPPKPQKPQPAAAPRPKPDEGDHLTTRSIGFAWPIQGKVTRKFGEGSDSSVKGVDLSAVSGGDVKAAKSGVVDYAGYPAPAYGYTVIMSHEGGYHTVYSRLTSLSVKNGDKIASGGAIGRLNKGEGFHFEIRRGSSAVDPLLYLPN